jgi:hypothetical protein
MKKIILIVILIFTCLLIAGCASTKTSMNTDYGMGMIIMPDGSIIKGECSNFQRISGNWALVTIDGVTYAASDWRIVRWK